MIDRANVLPLNRQASLLQVIPIRLDTDTCSFACSDGSDAVWIVDQEVPGSDASLDDGVVAALLPHPGFVLEPDFQGLACGAGRQCCLQQGGEVFLKASSAAATFFGW